MLNEVVVEFIYRIVQPWHVLSHHEDIPGNCEATGRLIKEFSYNMDLMLLSAAIVRHISKLYCLLFPETSK